MVLFDSFKEYADDYMLFGGAIRDIMLNQKPKDYDIVLLPKPQFKNQNFEEMFSDLVSKFKKGNTLYGGLKLNIDGILFDIWPRNQCCTFLYGQFSESWINMLKGVPFNVMAIIYSLKTQQVISLNGFWAGIENKILQFINKEEISRASMHPMTINKAISLANSNKLKLSVEVENYIFEYLNSKNYSKEDIREKFSVDYWFFLYYDGIFNVNPRMAKILREYTNFSKLIKPDEICLFKTIAKIIDLPQNIIDSYIEYNLQ